jgi:hypothetical protein
MSVIGEEWTKDSPFENPRFVMLRQGVLMGDPLTKVILHLVNILVRITGENYSSESFIGKIFPFKKTEIRKYIDEYCLSEAPPDYRFESREVVGEVDANPYILPLPEVSTLATAVAKEEVPIKTETPKKIHERSPKGYALSKGFILNDKWLSKSPNVSVRTENGEIKDYSFIKPSNVRRDPPTERLFTFRCAEIQGILRSFNEKEQKKLILSQENAEKIALQNGFTWNPLRSKPSPPVGRDDCGHFGQTEGHARCLEDNPSCIIS